MLIYRDRLPNHKDVQCVILIITLFSVNLSFEHIHNVKLNGALFLVCFFPVESDEESDAVPQLLPYHIQYP